MKPRALPFLLCSALSLGTTRAADGGAGAHARGSYDSATGVYTVVGGDSLRAIAARFGTSITRLKQDNPLTGGRVRVGQQLIVSAPATSMPIVTAHTPQAGTGPIDTAPAVADLAPGVTVSAPPTAPTPQAGPLAPDPAAPPVAPPLPTTPWPRRVQVADRTLLIYSPQVVTWADNQLELRAAVAVEPSDGGEQSFGIIQAQAQIQVDRFQRLVSLQGLKVTKGDFPAAPALAGPLAGAVAEQFATNVRVLPLDQFEAVIGAAQSAPSGGMTIQNPAPQVIVNFKPAILVGIQGHPVLRAVPNTNLQRIVNTRAVILTESADGLYYLHLLDGWVAAQTLAGPWIHAGIAPIGMDEVASRLAAAGEADLLNGRPSVPTMRLLAAGTPDVYVTETPTELIIFKGEPNLVSISGTDLLWATNTNAAVILDTTDGSNFALLAGRWYRAPALQGPWTYVASGDLPADFRQIPIDSPANVVLPAVAGTSQAREALIANAIPQTATVPRHGGPIFKPVFDGPTTVGLLQGTDMEYLVNCETPILRVGGESYYALQAGIWFTSATLDGPWVVAAAVPASIYTIPPSSPLHYVTYARIYGSTPEVVYAGYTPGYLGTISSNDAVVVYGTGYDYQPWIGNAWYAAPETFGLAAQPISGGRLGYGYAFGLGPVTPAVADSYWGSVNYRSAVPGSGCCATTTTNVYSYWGNAVAADARTWYDGAGAASGTATQDDHASKHDASAADPLTEDNTGVDDGLYAGADGNIYRHTSSGWQRHGDSGWQTAGGISEWADRELQARTLAAVRAAVNPIGDNLSRAASNNRFRNDGFGDDRTGSKRSNAEDPFHPDDIAPFGSGGFGGRIGGGR